MIVHKLCIELLGKQSKALPQKCKPQVFQQRNVFLHPADIQLHLINNKPRCSLYSHIGILSILLFLSSKFSLCSCMYICVYVLLWYHYMLVQMIAFLHGQSLLTTVGLFLLGSCIQVIWVAVDFCVEKKSFI